MRPDTPHFNAWTAAEVAAGSAELALYDAIARHVTDPASPLLEAMRLSRARKAEAIALRCGAAEEVKQMARALLSAAAAKEPAGHGRQADALPPADASTMADEPVVPVRKGRQARARHDARTGRGTARGAVGRVIGLTAETTRVLRQIEEARALLRQMDGLLERSPLIGRAIR